MKIIIDQNIPYINGVFENFADVGYFASSAITPTVVHDADALIIRTRTNCDATLLHNSKIKHIATATIGFDHINTQYCHNNNITYTTAAGCNARAVAQWVFAALRQMNITGGTIGIIGVGNVGGQVEKMAHERGFTTLLCDPPRAATEGAEKFTSLPELLQKSDIITLHVPLNSTTESMADMAFFNKLKHGAIFLNSSRGEVVDDMALTFAIMSGKLKSVALDVWRNEPNILVSLINSVNIATPHIAGYSSRGKAKATEMVVRSTAEKFNITALKNWIAPINPQLENPDLYNILSDDKALRANPLEFEQLRNTYNYR